MRSLVADKVAGDAKEGDPLATKLVGLITRKVVKQTVMTSVYGVTFIGAKRQVENRCAAQHTMAEACSLLTAHYLLLTTYCSLLPTPYYSLLPTPYSLLPTTPYSLPPTPYRLCELADLDYEGLDKQEQNLLSTYVARLTLDSLGEVRAFTLGPLTLQPPSAASPPPPRPLPATPPRPLTAPVKRRAEGGAPPTNRLRGASSVCHLTTTTREQGASMVAHQATSTILPLQT